MPSSRGYSATVKQEVVRLIESGLSIAEAARHANVSPSTARRWWKIYETDGPEALGIEGVTTANDPVIAESADLQAFVSHLRNWEHVEDEDEMDEAAKDSAEIVLTSDDAMETLEPAEESFDFDEPLAESSIAVPSSATHALRPDDRVPDDHAGDESASRQTWRNFRYSLNHNNSDDDESLSLRAKVAVVGTVLAIVGIAWIVDLATDASTNDCAISVIQSEMVLAAVADGRILWDPYWTGRFASERSALNWVADKRDWFFSECRPFLEEEAHFDELERIRRVFGTRP